MWELIINTSIAIGVTALATMLLFWGYIFIAYMIEAVKNINMYRLLAVVFCFIVWLAILYYSNKI